MEFEQVTLDTVCNGAIPELFNIELKKIIKNIQDMNTDGKAIREIKMSMKFKPHPTRKGAAIEIEFNSKLASNEGVSTILYLGMEKGQPVAYENMVEQLDIPEPVDIKEGGTNA